MENGHYDGELCPLPTVSLKLEVKILLTVFLCFYYSPSREFWADSTVISIFLGIHRNSSSACRLNTRTQWNEPNNCGVCIFFYKLNIYLMKCPLNSHLDVSGGLQAIAFCTKVGHGKTVTGCPVLLSPGHQIGEVILPVAFEHRWQTWIRERKTKLNFIISKRKVFRRSYVDRTLLFLSDLLHQTSDLDVLIPLFTSRGCCTAAFWENMFQLVRINSFIKEERN